MRLLPATADAAAGVAAVAAAVGSAAASALLSLPFSHRNTRHPLNESSKGKFLLKDCKTREEKNERHEG